VERATAPLPRSELDSDRLSRTLNAEEIDAIVRAEAGDDGYNADEPSLQESIGDRSSVGPHRSSGGMQVWVQASAGVWVLVFSFIVSSRQLAATITFSSASFFIVRL
jgi:hypothetical protein